MKLSLASDDHMLDKGSQVMSTKTTLLYVGRSTLGYTDVVYFDQLSGACSTWKLVELLFSAVFNIYAHANVLQKTGKELVLNRY